MLKLLLAEQLVLEAATVLLNQQRVSFELYHLSLDNLFFNGALGDQPVYVDAVLLADTMRTVHCLKIHLRVPVAIIDDHGVCGSEINTESTSSCAQEKDELRGVICRELADLLVARVHIGIAVNAAVLELAEIAVVFEDVEHHGHLREDQDLVAAAQA